MPSSCAAIDHRSDVDEEEDQPVLHLLVQAGAVPPPELRAAAVRTVFELGALQPLGRRLWRQPAAQPSPYRVERDVGLVRVVRLRPQETTEWQANEIARRAKQRPPRPPKKAKTRGRKLLDLIGDALDD